MATRVGLESYEVVAKHGVFDYEKTDEQPFVVSIWATLANDAIGDDIAKWTRRRVPVPLSSAIAGCLCRPPLPSAVAGSKC